MMNKRFKVALTVLGLALGTGMARAQEEVPAPKRPARRSTEASTAKAKEKVKSNRDAIVKRVDINSATKDQLMKVPSITEAYADKIIKGRPYLSKTHLVTRGILSESFFAGIKDQIQALQPGVKLPAEKKPGAKPPAAK